MANHPLNLALRFILELAALYALGNWGWSQHAGLARPLLGLGLPLGAALLWGIFRVPDDPGKATVPIPGLLRLLLELLVLGGAVWALYAAGQARWALVYGLVTLGHYLISYDRLQWLLKQD